MLGPPPQIGRYQIKSRLARGGMGDLYLARDTNPLTPRLVVLKLLNASLDSADLRDRFAREARALASLSHPNIVRIFDSGEFQGSPYIVMEYIRGETLGEKIKRQAAMTLAQKLKAMVELCDGLAQAHDAGIVHRDIKPANLMVDLDGWLRILDFGIARVAESSRTHVGGGAQLTQLNMRIGTPGYMSPEQIEGGEIDPRTDIFAVGAVCYELLSYREAFPGTTTRQIENAVLQASPKPLASFVPGLDPELQAIIDRALEKDPGRRYQDAISLREAFEQQRARLRVSDTPVPGPTRVRQTRGSGGGQDSRAGAAFKRAVEVYDEKAFDASRRFAIEALAEDPKHEDARTLLSRLDPGLLEENAATLVYADSNAETVVAAGTEPRRSRRRWLSSTYVWIAAGVLAVAGVAAAILLAMEFWPSGHLLTIAKPEHGTITAPGITCGSAGSDCTATIREEDAIELVVQADEGYAFVGYTGNCAPSGRTVMSAPRTCGATFEPIPDKPGGANARTLTIVPPKGGTVLGVNIKCGTLGNDCTEDLPDGVPVTLHAYADKGFVFQQFTGDCTPEGETQMTAARSCGASFQAATVRQTAVVPRPDSTPRRTPSSRPTATPTLVLPEVPTQPEAPSTPAAPAEPPPPPPISPEDQAKKEIDRTLSRYCAAYERRDADAIGAIFPGVSPALREQLKQFRSVECSLAEAPKYDELDPDGGKALLNVGVRLVLQMTVGGQRTQETIAKVGLSRREPGNWIIRSIEHRPKR
jgi:serine/threonine protein kinase